MHKLAKVLSLILFLFSFTYVCTGMALPSSSPQFPLIISNRSPTQYNQTYYLFVNNNLISPSVAINKTVSFDNAITSSNDEVEIKTSSGSSGLTCLIPMSYTSILRADPPGATTINCNAAVKHPRNGGSTIVKCECSKLNIW